MWKAKKDLLLNLNKIKELHKLLMQTSLNKPMSLMNLLCKEMQNSVAEILT